jgi:hypothetical protein
MIGATDSLSLCTNSSDNMIDDQHPLKTNAASIDDDDVNTPMMINHANPLDVRFSLVIILQPTFDHHQPQAWRTSTPCRCHCWLLTNRHHHPHFQSAPLLISSTTSTRSPSSLMHYANAPTRLHWLIVLFVHPCLSGWEHTWIPLFDMTIIYNQPLSSTSFSLVNTSSLIYRQAFRSGEGVGGSMDRQTDRHPGPLIGAPRNSRIRALLLTLFSHHVILIHLLEGPHGSADTVNDSAFSCLLHRTLWICQCRQHLSGDSSIAGKQYQPEDPINICCQHD